MKRVYKSIYNNRHFSFRAHVTLSFHFNSTILAKVATVNFYKKETYLNEFSYIAFHCRFYYYAHDSAEFYIEKIKLNFEDCLSI